MLALAIPISSAVYVSPHFHVSQKNCMGNMLRLDFLPFSSPVYKISILARHQATQGELMLKTR